MPFPHRPRTGRSASHQGNPGASPGDAPHESTGRPCRPDCLRVAKWSESSPVLLARPACIRERRVFGSRPFDRTAHRIGSPADGFRPRSARMKHNSATGFDSDYQLVLTVAKPGWPPLCITPAAGAMNERRPARMTSPGAVELRTRVEGTWAYRRPPPPPAPVGSPDSAMACLRLSLMRPWSSTRITLTLMTSPIFTTSCTLLT